MLKITIVIRIRTVRQHFKHLWTPWSGCSATMSVKTLKTHPITNNVSNIVSTIVCPSPMSSNLTDLPWGRHVRNPPPGGSENRISIFLSPKSRGRKKYAHLQKIFSKTLKIRSECHFSQSCGTTRKPLTWGLVG